MRIFDPNTFETTIPGQLGLSKPSKNTIAEGVVLRLKYEQRVCMKYKADKFGEIDTTIKGRLKRDISLPMNIKDIERDLINDVFDGNRMIIDFIYQCITENRLGNIKSKIGGDMDSINYNKILGSFTADVWNEVKLNYPDEIETIGLNNINQIKHFVTECVREFLNLNGVIML